MKNSDETIVEILQGHKTARWPAPKLSKIFIASTRNGKYYLIACHYFFKEIYWVSAFGMIIISNLQVFTKGECTLFLK